jgi:DNA-binding response OmpR family regulator
MALPAHPKTILVIEDDAETAALLAEDLTDRGWQIRVARNGAEGMSAILRDAPDLVLCDINMPVMSGFEVLERLTALAPRFTQVPFIFLTALADRESNLKGRHLGADDYVVKPIDFEILATVIMARFAGVARSEIWPKAVGLTAREVETLTWAARGKTSKEIAGIVGLTKRTVDFHIDNARVKLGTMTRIETVIKAMSGRLIEP